MNQTGLNQQISSDSTKIGSIHDLADILEIENILSSPVHLVHKPYPVPAPPIFTHGTESYPLSPSHES